ncbi:hypothetical protein [Variovorax sp. PAMC 28711]|uniref:hypothetical protein n=1 Tax=Variovorax sp. PAMC 28711 TaxID=1795631 RepID=UPI00078CC6B3|nr:hypothetical protein [Variovorax sp. PAMC 28711]AMM23397.1 hypothetical protein AX767_02730 [Variovorax sp. PAMC 28711]
MSLTRSTFFKWAAAATVAAGALFAANSANAGVNWSVGIAAPGIAVGVNQPYYAPAPVYYNAPQQYYAPPQQYYAPPPPVYYRPAPVYYAPPAPVYYGPGRGYYRGGPGYRHHRDWR